MPSRLSFAPQAVKFFLLCCLSLGARGPLWSRAKAEAAGAESRNKEWVLSITAFDLSSLPPGRRPAGDILVRDLLESIALVDSRMRMEEEYGYYRDYAWAQAKNEAAKKLAAKRTERDQILFRGDPDWKYRKTLKTLDADIKKLEEDFVIAWEAAPRVEEKPALKIAGESGPLPSPPAEGGEYRFCRSQGADAFLEGRISEFHGRIFIRVRMYTLYTRSFRYEDFTIFSTEDTAAALDELAGRLVAAVSGSEPAFIAVHAEPPEALVTINGAFAGRGTVEPRERPPGEAVVEVFADDHGTVSLPVGLRAGEVAEMYINLQPLGRQALILDVPGKPGTSVYRGARYLGETPLSLSMRDEDFEYFHVETAEGETGEIIVQGTGRGSENPPIFDVRLRPPPGKDEKPVGTARKRFYGAYGRFWIALPVAFILNGVYTAFKGAYANNPTDAMYDTSMTYYYISTGAAVLAGGFLAESFYRIFRYIRSSSTDTTPPIVK